MQPARFGLRDLDQVADPVTSRHLHQAKSVARRIETHGFGVDCNLAAEIKPGGQVALVEMNAHRTPPQLASGPPFKRTFKANRSRLAARTAAAEGHRSDGAQERTRTFTALRPLAPEASASTNSATWAQAVRSPG